MKTKTITQVKKFKLMFEKFDDWVYIKCSNFKTPYLLSRKYFDEMEAKHTKNREGPYYWLLKHKWQDMYVALSTGYLKQYFEESGGYYTPDYQTWCVNPLPLLRANVKDRYYQAHMDDGFLHFDGKPVRCPFVIELRKYHSQQKVLKILQKNPKVLSAELKDTPFYYEDGSRQYIHMVYLPSVREFNKLVVEGNKTSLDVQWYVISRLGIDKFKKEEY